MRKPMDRRLFTNLVLLAPPLWSSSAFGQEKPVDGKHYVTLSSRQATADPKQVEAIEFFAYA